MSGVLAADPEQHDVPLSEWAPRVPNVRRRATETERDGQMPDVPFADIAQRWPGIVGGARQTGPSHGRGKGGVLAPAVWVQQSDRRPARDRPREIVPPQADRSVPGVWMPVAGRLRPVVQSRGRHSPRIRPQHNSINRSFFFIL